MQLTEKGFNDFRKGELEISDVEIFLKIDDESAVKLESGRKMIIYR